MVAKIAIVGGGPAGLCLAGIFERNGYDYVVYEHSTRNVAPRGGCLDLRSWGQDALKEAGCYEAWDKIARRGDAQILNMFDTENNPIAQLGNEEGHDSPEADRSQLKAALLTSVPDEKIRWSTDIDSVQRDSSGAIVLNLRGGEVVRGHQLVIGADGLGSKVRELVTPAKPKFSGICIIPRVILPTDPYFAEIQETVGISAYNVLGKNTGIWAQLQGEGLYRIDFLFQGEAGSVEKDVDLTNDNAVEAYLLQPDKFGNHAQIFKKWIQVSSGPSHPWYLHYMPPESLCWEPATDVTLIGDAAHATLPFAGEGVNVALSDASSLFRSLQKFGFTKQAIGEYEREMFKRASDVIIRSNENGKLFFNFKTEESDGFESSVRGFLHYSEAERVY